MMWPTTKSNEQRARVKVYTHIPTPEDVDGRCELDDGTRVIYDERRCCWVTESPR